MSEFFTPYEGRRPYLFISYSHRNSAEVLDTITLLHKRRVRLWYDEGIPAGNDWPRNIESHLRLSSMVLFFQSKTALSSLNCQSEIETALALKKPVMYFTLDDSVPEGRWAELMKDCIPLETPSGAVARADTVIGHRKLRRSFYLRWTEKLPKGMFGFILSLLLFAAALLGAWGVWAGWFDFLLPGQEIPQPTATPRPTPRPTATPTPTPEPTATNVPTATPEIPHDMSEVKFPDEQQAKAVRRILNRSEGEKVYLNELAAVTELSIVGNMHAADIQSTVFTHAGDCLVNGGRVSKGKVKDLSLIGKMIYLEKLALVCQPLSDASDLSGLVMLSELYLSGDASLSGLGRLRDLPRLETLHLEHSGVRDLSPLSSLPSLRTVTVSADMLPLIWPEAFDFTVVLVP